MRCLSWLPDKNERENGGNTSDAIRTGETRCVGQSWGNESMTLTKLRVKEGNWEEGEGGRQEAQRGEAAAVVASTKPKEAGWGRLEGRERERQGGNENVCVSGGWFMSRVCSSWQKKHNAVAFENDNERLHKAADLKFLRRKQIQAAG